MDNYNILKNGYRLLDTFPEGKKTKRQPFLRVKFLDNRKVFFSIFLSKIKSYNLKDKARRFGFIEFLPFLFKNIKPIENGNNFIFQGEINGIKFKVVLKEVFNKKKRKELFLLSIYPN